MKTFIYILLLTCSSIAYASSESTIKTLFMSLTKTMGKVKTKGCQLQKDKWSTLLLTRESFNEDIKYNNNCDLEGRFKVQIDQYFPIRLNIRNLTGYKRLNANLKLQVILEQMPILDIQMQKSILQGNEDIHFDMNYGIYIRPMNKSPFQQHKGGNIFIRKIGKKVIYKKINI